MDHKHLGMVIRERVGNYSDRIAMRYRNETNGEWVGITWNAMWEQSQLASKALISLGVKEQEMVSIFSQNMPEWTIADIAIMNIRGVTVPIYSTNSAVEARYIIEESNVKVIFVGEQEQYDRTMEIIKQGAALKKVVVFDSQVKLSNTSDSMYFSDFLQLGEKSKTDKELENRMNSVERSDLATLIYTSGTTGEPKGVMLDHENFIKMLEAHDEELNVSEKDISLSFLPLSHVFERGWTFVCLHRGIEIYYNRDPKQIAAAIKEVKPTVMCTVPRIYEKIYTAIHDKRQEASRIKNSIMDWTLKIGGKYFNKYLRFNRPVPRILKWKFRIADRLVLSKLRDIFGGRINFMPCGGAPISPEILEYFHSFGINVRCGYGLTETMGTVSLFGHKNFLFNTVGKPGVGVQVKIGENDEIMVKSPGVMRGYYKKPEETAKVFKNGWFCTGDAGKMDKEGNLVITDRIKDIMKTSCGKYVAPQKLESVLINDEFIEQIAVIGDCRKYVTALAVPAFDLLKQYASKKNIVFNTIEELINNVHVVEFFEKRFEEIQKEFSNFEKIKKFTLLPKEFTIEKGEITSTLKIKRKVIQRKYKHLIEKMYKE